MDLNVIRGMIFLVAGFIMIFFSRRVYGFQKSVIRKLHIKVDLKHEKKNYVYFGIVFIVIAMIFFVVSIIFWFRLFFCIGCNFCQGFLGLVVFVLRFLILSSQVMQSQLLRLFFLLLVLAFLHQEGEHIGE